MVFSSIIFLFFFLPITLVVYFVCGRRLKNSLLLFLSLLFYAWGEGFFVLIMLCSIAGNYLAGLLIEKFRERGYSQIFLLFAVLLNLGLLISFKYANFIVDNINLFLPYLNLNRIHIDPVHLPIGISFFTFQAMTYVIDVYRKKAPMQKNLINIGLYISLFPQLIAGPIVRYHDIAKQIISRKVNLDGFSKGVERFIYGLGKKVLIANALAVPADKIFSIPPDGLTFGLAWFGIICYTLQIYFDFSGYSDMAIGLGRMFGFRFLENFNYPYISRSIREFWQRWHISLSNWFRDYLYIPLGGNRKGALRTYANLLIVFFLCGLWHGASWNFVIWGMIHGLFLVIERAGLESLLKQLWLPLRYVYTLLVVVTAWVFFRVETLTHAIYYLLAMFGFAKGDGIAYHTDLYLDNEVKLVLITGIIFSAPVLPYLKQVKENYAESINNTSAFWTESLSAFSSLIFLILILLGSIMSLAAGSYNPFIYFRF
jgi:alginate O-acetyltransferase complex protein AlgI